MSVALMLSLMTGVSLASPDAAPAAAATPALACSSDASLPLTELPLSELPALVEGARGCVLVFELYASWCAPCVTLAPAVNALARSYSDRGVMVRGLSVDTDRQRLEKFHAEHGGAFAPLVLESWNLADLGAVLGTLGADFKDAVPLLLVFDREGRLVYQASEPGDLSGVEAALQPLL